MRTLIKARPGLLFFFALVIPAVFFGIKAKSFATTEAQRKPAQVTTEQIWIAKPDSGKSCLKGSGIDLDIAEKELLVNHITVFERKKIFSSKPHIQMCGADQGTLNAYLIASKDKDAALKLGFTHQIF